MARFGEEVNLPALPTGSDVTSLLFVWGTKDIPPNENPKCVHVMYKKPIIANSSHFK